MSLPQKKGGNQNWDTLSCDVNTAFEVISLETQAGFGSMSSCCHYDSSSFAL